MRAIFFLLCLLVVGCGPDLQLAVTPRDGGATTVNGFPAEVAPTFELSLFDARFIRLECAVVFCSKITKGQCFCSTEELCMREAHAESVPARGCDILPWPQIAPNYYGLGFHWGWD